MKFLAFTMTRINGEVPKVRYHGLAKADLDACFRMSSQAREAVVPGSDLDRSGPAPSGNA
jgi:hypothetical protein